MEKKNLSNLSGSSASISILPLASSSVTPLHVLHHYILESSLWCFSFPPACHLLIQYPLLHGHLIISPVGIDNMS